MINRMYVRINLGVQDGNWKPGVPFINDPKYGLNNLSDSEKNKVLTGFCKFLAIQMRKLLKNRIVTQYRYLYWAPLTPGYTALKAKLGLSPNIWEATGLLLKSIGYYKEGDSYIVGVNPHVYYPNSRVKVLFVAKCMEFGTRYMPARPLFGPTINFMRRHVRKYWELYLSTKYRRLL